MLFSNKKSWYSARKAAFLFAFVSLTVVTFASIGGEKSKGRKGSLASAFLPVKTASGFSLKSGLTYRGSMVLKQVKSNDAVSFSSLVRYQKGNATYILPNNYRVSVAPAATNSNLQMVNLKFKLCK